MKLNVENTAVQLLSDVQIKGQPTLPFLYFEWLELRTGSAVNTLGFLARQPNMILDY
ncbi:hypothetical protein GCM10009332_03880 [Shewanella gelidii]|uniref:Uncharacterized protein n=1 Tax=Shewanella gelidii TaxID=1642821 RepID=A0A917JKL2_9GAMM|nr:hypothetical protein GCM10009332_03880 [Shewanella gelidii]